MDSAAVVRWALIALCALYGYGLKVFLTRDVLDIWEWIVLDFSGQTEKAAADPEFRTRLIHRIDQVLKRLPLAKADISGEGDWDNHRRARAAIHALSLTGVFLLFVLFLASIGVVSNPAGDMLAVFFALPFLLFAIAGGIHLAFYSGIRESRFVKCRMYKIFLLNLDGNFAEMERECAILADAATDPTDRVFHTLDRAYCLSKVGRAKDGLAAIGTVRDDASTAHGVPGAFRRRLFRLPLRSDYFRIVQEGWLDPKMQAVSLLLQLRETGPAREALADIARRYPRDGRDPRPGLYAATLLSLEGNTGEAEIRLEKVWEDGDETWCDELLKSDPALAPVKPWWDKRVASREHTTTEGLDRI